MTLHEIRDAFAPERLAEMREGYAPRALHRQALFAPEYELARAGRLRCYYAPFGTVLSQETRLVIVGLTPGFRQTALAAAVFRDADPELRRDHFAFSALLREKVAFAGTMRSSLCAMLDELGLAQLLGLRRSGELFRSTTASVGMMSALPYPIVVGEERRNFSGAPRVAHTPLFRQILDTCFLPRIQTQATKVFFLPLGRAVESIMDYAIAVGTIAEENVIRGFPHPSLANVSRRDTFGRNASRIRARLRAALA